MSQEDQSARSTRSHDGEGDNQYQDAPPAKKLKTYHEKYVPPRYLHLLNEMIDEVKRPYYAQDFNIKSGHIGQSYWSPAEKIIVLQALQRYPADFNKLAKAVQTKSSVEVKAYVDAVRADRDAAAAMKPRKHYWNYLRIPSAVQVPRAIEQQLEACSNRLAQKIEHDEAELSQAKYGDLWKLDWNVEHWANENLNGDQSQGSAELQECLPAAELLNLTSWLELSLNVFMNPAEDFEHEILVKPVRGMTRERELPALHITAFEDFHTMAVGITERLVRAACYIAEARQRVNPSVQKPEIGIDHVKAATELLGLESSSWEFWRTAARRNNLRVFDRSVDDFQDHDTVEKRLSYRGKRRPRKVKGDAESPLHTAQDTPSSVAALEVHVTQADGQEEEDLEEDELDIELERLDKLTSQKDLNKLRAIVSLDPIEVIEAIDDSAERRIKVHKLQLFPIVKPWMEGCHYSPEWELQLLADGDSSTQEVAGRNSADEDEEMSSGKGTPSPGGSNQEDDSNPEQSGDSRSTRSETAASITSQESGQSLQSRQEEEEEEEGEEDEGDSVDSAAADTPKQDLQDDQVISDIQDPAQGTDIDDSSSVYSDSDKSSLDEDRQG